MIIIWGPQPPAVEPRGHRSATRRCAGGAHDDHGTVEEGAIVDIARPTENARHAPSDDSSTAHSCTTGERARVSSGICTTCHGPG